MTLTKSLTVSKNITILSCDFMMAHMYTFLSINNGRFDDVKEVQECLYARIARKMMRCKVRACIEANRTVSISLQNNGEMRI